MAPPERNDGRQGMQEHHSDDARAATTPRVRVCMLSFYFHPSYSGSAEQAHSLSRHLLRMGVVPEIVSANLTNSAPVDDLDGIRVRRLPVIKRKSLQIPTFNIGLALHLVRHRREYQIVHAHGTFQHAVASVICRVLGRKSILKIAMGDSDIAFQRQGRTWGRVNRFLVNRFDRYIATSTAVQKECVAQGLDGSRVVLIPNGVDTAKFRPAESDHERRNLRRQLGLPDEPIVCFVGIIDERKNVDGILRIWRTAIRLGAHGHLVLVGPEPKGDDGRASEFCQRLRRFVQDEGIEDTVTFAGRRSDVTTYLRSSDVFLFPSRREGMPNVLLEAMASGLACVVSNIGGSADLIHDGRNGYLVSLDDEDGMAARVNALLVDLRQARDLGRAARRSVEERLSLDATAERYRRLYSELLAEG